MLGRLGSIVGTLRDSDLRWGPGDRVAFDAAPAQPLALSNVGVGTLRDSDLRWGPGDRVAFDAAPAQPLALSNVGVFFGFLGE
jgi:hypothetical protein